MRLSMGLQRQASGATKPALGLNTRVAAPWKFGTRFSQPLGSANTASHASIATGTAEKFNV